MVLITGATGFIGKKLVSKLSAKEKVVAAVRSINTEIEKSVVQVQVGSINSETNWKPCLEGVDVVIHLAARTSSKQGGKESINTVNSHATINLAHQASEMKVRRFIFISSVKVNGENTFGRAFTADDVCKPESDYGLSKFKAEQGLFAISNENEMEIVVIRPPLVYGGNSRGNFNLLLKLISIGVPLPLGNIKNRRSLVCVDNLVSLISTCILHPDAKNRVFLVSDDYDLSTSELLIQLGRAFGFNVRLIPVPSEFLKKSLPFVGGRRIAMRLFGDLQVDIDETKKVLNWYPPVKTLDALKKQASVPNSKSIL